MPMSVERESGNSLSSTALLSSSGIQSDSTISPWQHNPNQYSGLKTSIVTGGLLGKLLIIDASVTYVGPKPLAPFKGFNV